MLPLKIPLRFVFVCFLSFGTIHGALGAWVQKASFGGTAKHRCTGFSINNKGYIGGGHTNSGTVAYFKDYWEYDPGADTWTQIADFGGGYRYHSNAFSIGNYGYVGLGEDDNNAYHNDFWKYIPLINTWVQVAPFPGMPRRGACAFVINSEGYVGTGQTDGGYTTDFYKYDPALNSWQAIADFTGEARSSAVAFAHNGKGYLGTGHVLGDDRNDFFSYDPLTDTWSQKADVGALSRQDATGFVVMGEGYIGTGNDVEGDENYNDFWKYNFDNDTWTEAAEFDGQGRRYMVSFVIGDVAFCGTGTDGTNFRDFWAFYPLLDIDESGFSREFSLYPNPTAETVQVILKEDVTCDHITVIDLQGKVVLDQSFYNNKTVDVQHLENGIYTIIILEQNQIIYTGKIAIQK